MTSTPRTRALAGAMYIVAATLLWSAIPICVKVAVKAVDAYTMCWIRFFAGSIVLFGLAFVRRADLRIPRVEWKWVVLAAFGLGIDYVAYIRGIQSTTASASNVVVQFEVIMIVILSYVWLKERMSRAKVVGMLVTFAGVFLALSNGESLADLRSSEHFLGNMLILSATPLWAMYVMGQKILATHKVSVSVSLAYIFGLAAIITLPTVFIGFEVRLPFTPAVWIALITLVIPSTVGAYLLIGRGFKLLDASTAGVISCLLPIFTIINARIFLGEPTSLAVGIGAALVVLGIGVIARDEASATSLAEAPGP